MQQKTRLRQRHGSDALRLDNALTTSATSPQLEQTEFISSKQINNLRPLAVDPSTPISRNNNTKEAFPDFDARAAADTPTNRTYRSASVRNVPSNAHHSASMYSQRPLQVSTKDVSFDRSRSLTSPIDARTGLPSGAHTPSVDSSFINGHPVVTYPPPPPTWRNMPAKPQLAILALSRFVDFFQTASLQTYMVHQLKSFDSSLPSTVISHQAGVLQGAFTASQIVTSILWGRAADRPTVGRKLVLMIGLVGTAITMIGVGFSSSFEQAVFWRVMGGAINGTVGAARTMVAETVDKRWHPRAFLLLPAAFNVANVAGPILGGLLVDPIRSYPHLFGAGSAFGGADGVQWMLRHPYALANMLSTVLLLGEAVLVHHHLRETLKGYRKTPFRPLAVIKDVISNVRGVTASGKRILAEPATLKRALLSRHDDNSIELDAIGSNKVHDALDANEKGQPRPVQRLAFRRIWTSNVLWTLLTIAIFDFHMGAFNNLWTLFLSANRVFVANSEKSLNVSPEALALGDELNPGLARRALMSLLQVRSPDSADTIDPLSSTNLAPRSAFKFAGGLAFPPTTIGLAMAIIGFVGVTLQFLLYPWANARYGLMRCFRYSLVFFPLAYFLAPYISLLPSTSPSPLPATGFWVWAGISLVITLQVAARYVPFHLQLLPCISLDHLCMLESHIICTTTCGLVYH